MDEVLPGIFALLVAAAGWFYLFYSRAAIDLATIEAQRTNRLRVRLRRIGGAVMILLAFVTYGACVAIHRDDARAAALYLLTVFISLMIVLVLGLFDLRLTRQLRRSQQRNRG